MATFFWFAVAYSTAFGLGHAKGEIHEHERQERAERKVANRTFNVRDISEGRR